MKRYRIGYLMMIGGFVFSIIETKYFGWNLTPQSTPEIICDMICFFCIMFGFLIFCSKPTKTEKI
jgi:vacuolar-type H+-ATPase subunit I/STV1